MQIVVRSNTGGILWRDGFYIPPEGIELDDNSIDRDVLLRWQSLPELQVEIVKPKPAKRQGVREGGGEETDSGDVG